MTWTRTLLIGAGLVVALGAFAGGGMADRRAGTAEHGHLDWCDGAVERLEIMSAAGPIYLGLDDGQTAAWTTLMADLRQALASFEETCMAGIAAEPAGSAPVRLAGLRDQLATGIAAIDRVRPAFDAFYRGLDAGQQARIEAMLARGRHR